MLEQQLQVPDALWTRLNLAWVGFFAVMGGLNLFVAFNYSTDTWVNFKLFGTMGLMIAFIIGQGLLLAKYVEAEPEPPVEPAVEPADRLTRRTTPMLYAIVATDVPNSLEARSAARPAHLARLMALQTEGRMILAGPLPAIDSPDPGPAGFTGSLIVAEFDSLAAATAWADADPYRAAGVYAEISVRPFKQVLPTP